MVSSEDEEILWVLDLVCEEKADRLERLFAAIDIVAQEQIVGLRWESSILKETKKIVVLSVNITANLNASNRFCARWYDTADAHLDGGFQLEQYWLRDENFTGFGAQISDLCFKQLNLLSRSATSDF